MRGSAWIGSLDEKRQATMIAMLENVVGTLTQTRYRGKGGKKEAKAALAALRAGPGGKLASGFRGAAAEFLEGLRVLGIADALGVTPDFVAKGPRDWRSWYRTAADDAHKALFGSVEDGDE